MEIRSRKSDQKGMPIFHFTFHAYRSWNADHEEGYRQHGQRGIIPPDDGIARYRNRIARFPKVVFNTETQNIFVVTARSVCSGRKWRLHAIVATTSHVHLAVSWGTEEPVSVVQGTLKRLMSREMGRLTHDGLTHRFSRGASHTRIRDRSHLRQLVNEYYPQHSGVYWKEQIQR